MSLFGRLIEFSQHALSTLYDFGNRMLEFLSTEYILFGESFTLFSLIFGSGLFLYIGVRLVIHLATIVIDE